MSALHEPTLVIQPLQIIGPFGVVIYLTMLQPLRALLMMHERLNSHLLREYPGRQYLRFQGPVPYPMQRCYSDKQSDVGRNSYVEGQERAKGFGEKIRMTFSSTLPKKLWSNIYRPPATHDAYDAAPFEADNE